MTPRSMILVALLAFGAFGAGGSLAEEPLATGIGPDAQGRLPPAVQPPWPERIPDYAQMDSETGLHMTGEPQLIRVSDYVLRVEGEVERPLELGYDDIRRLPRVGSRPTLVCEGFFVDLASWAGASLAALLRLAGPKEGVRSITLVSADGYEMTVDVDLATAPEAYLAYELEGHVLPILHG
ncbi:MAG: molybdopterin-dependent oxidoreductase, partial [Spirochaetaceae bacterium]|nr:molybdopterin-dependent oxidoreductase [Spirochaetaceae bacterium]